MSLKFENVATIGDTIKAFDTEPMEGRPDRFVQGEVTEITMAHGTKCFVVESDSGISTYVPMEANFDFDCRVTKLN